MAAVIALLPVRIVSLFACNAIKGNKINLTILALSMQQILNVCFFFFVILSHDDNDDNLLCPLINVHIGF